MISIRETIVVEGRYDVNKLKQLVDATIIETRGFGIFKDADKLEMLRQIASKTGLIILTDSDGAGFVIRNYLKGALPSNRVKHAYIPDVFGKERRKANHSKEGKLGVEGMQKEVIYKALKNAGATFLDGECTERASKNPITKGDLYALGLIGGTNSKERRLRLLEQLHLPQYLSTNALIEYLNIVSNRDEINSILSQFDIGY